MEAYSQTVGLVILFVDVQHIHLTQCRFRFLSKAIVVIDRFFHAGFGLVGNREFAILDVPFLNLPYLAAVFGTKGLEHTVFHTAGEMIQG